MDEIDQKILEELKKDAATPLSQIAERIGVPKPTVYLRFNKMKERGVIRGFHLLLGETADAALRGLIIRLRNYPLSGIGERNMARIGERVAAESGVVFAARLPGNAILVYHKEALDPSGWEGVLSVERLPAQIFKR